MKKLISSILLSAAMLSMLAAGVQAADYSFSTSRPPDYYASTSYAEVYGSQYNYGGPNLIDYRIPELEYGSFSTTQTGVAERSQLPGLQESAFASTSGGGYGITGGGGAVTVLPGIAEGAGGTLLPDLSGFPQYTELTDDFLLSNGAVGKLSIPSIGVRDYYVWEGTSSSSMSKGVGHFANTSVWNGNVGICGHNRGAAYVIGSIKDLDVGDKITYQTSEGKRTYAVEKVAAIQSNDWSYLEVTADNRITLITCVAGDSTRRWMVQAVESV